MSRVARTAMLAVVASMAMSLGMREAPAGKLARAADSVDAPSSSDSGSRDRDRRRRNCDDDDDDSIVGDILGGILGAMFDAAFNGSSDDCDCGESMESSLPAIQLYFADYPYDDGYPGYMVPLSLSPWPPKTRLRQVWVDYGTNFDDIQSVGAALRTEHNGGFGLDLRWRHYYEDLGATTDELGIGGVGVFARCLESEQGVLRLGLGVPLMEYEGDFDGGLSFTLGIDLFPTEPWTLGVDSEFGKLGSADFTRLRSTIGVTVRRTEFLTGAEYVKIEDVDFTNMIFGVRIWW